MDDDYNNNDTRAMAIVFWLKLKKWPQNIKNQINTRNTQDLFFNFNDMHLNGYVKLNLYNSYVTLNMIKCLYKKILTLQSS